MNQQFAVSVKVAGVGIRFISDSETDISNLSHLFRHHLCSEPGTYYLVEICAVTKNVIPRDARTVWKGFYHGIGKPEDGLHNVVNKLVSADGSTEYFLTDSGECICNDLPGNKTVCSVIKRRAFFRRCWERSYVGNVINLLIHIVMARHRRYSLHASAVVWRGRAIVFTGLSGRGKSTLSTDLVARGAGFLGDDLVFLYQHNGEPRIASLLFDAKLFESSTKDKDFIDILERYHREAIDNVPLQAIAEICLTKEGASTVESVTDDDRMLSVILQAANNIALQYDHDDWMTLCANVMAHYHLYTFHFGDRKLLKADILDRFYE